MITMLHGVLLTRKKYTHGDTSSIQQESSWSIQLSVSSVCLVFCGVNEFTIAICIACFPVVSHLTCTCPLFLQDNSG